MRSGETLIVYWAARSYASGWSARTLVPMRAISARDCSTVAFGASRAKTSVMRCVRPCFIVALRWCGLVTMFTNRSVRVG